MLIREYPICSSIYQTINPMHHKCTKIITFLYFLTIPENSPNEYTKRTFKFQPAFPISYFLCDKSYHYNFESLFPHISQITKKSLYDIHTGIFYIYTVIQIQIRQLSVAYFCTRFFPQTSQTSPLFTCPHPQHVHSTVSVSRFGC